MQESKWQQNTAEAAAAAVQRGIQSKALIDSFVVKKGLHIPHWGVHNHVNQILEHAAAHM